MSKHVITVLQSDIDNGKRRDWFQCPIALAAGRDLNKEYVGVSNYLTIGMRDYPLPEEAIQFALRFDGGQPVEPFKFKIEIGEDK